MKKLKDYEWLCGEYRIKEVILKNKSYKEVFERRLVGGFVTQLIGTKLLNL